jgi:hypothetical protein
VLTFTWKDWEIGRVEWSELCLRYCADIYLEGLRNWKCGNKWSVCVWGTMLTFTWRDRGIGRAWNEVAFRPISWRHYPGFYLRDWRTPRNALGQPVSWPILEPRNSWIRRFNADQLTATFSRPGHSARIQNGSYKNMGCRCSRRYCYVIRVVRLRGKRYNPSPHRPTVECTPPGY